MIYARTIGAALLLCCQVSLARTRPGPRPKGQAGKSASTSSCRTPSTRPSRARCVGCSPPSGRASPRRPIASCRSRDARSGRWRRRTSRRSSSEAAKKGVVVTAARSRLAAIDARDGGDKTRREAEGDGRARQGLQGHPGRQDHGGAAARGARARAHDRTSRMPTAPAEPAKITVAFNDSTTFTIVRTSVDIKPDMCIWRGTVEGTGEPGHADVVGERQDDRHRAGRGPP